MAVGAENMKSKAVGGRNLSSAVIERASVSISWHSEIYLERIPYNKFFLSITQNLWSSILWPLRVYQSRLRAAFDPEMETSRPCGISYADFPVDRFETNRPSCGLELLLR